MGPVTTEVLRRARAGDEFAFAELTEPFRRELHVHCYRMLGSVDDADDLLQETLLGAWQGLSGYAERASIRTWLYTIATRRCLNAIRDGRRRPAPAPQPPFEPPEPTTRDTLGRLQPYPTERADPTTLIERRDSLRLAFIAAVQQVPPRQAATVLLVDVLGFSTAEVAQMLGATPTTIKGLLQRARAALPVRSDAAADSRRPADDDDQLLADRFAEAYGRDDVDAVVDLLTERAWLSMPPAPHAYQGRTAIAGFLRASADHRAGRHFRLLPIAANDDPAFACYLSGETFQDLEPTATDRQRATGIIVLRTGSQGIVAITHFLNPRLAGHFGLPDVIDRRPPATSSR